MCAVEPSEANHAAEISIDENTEYFRDILLRLTFAAHGWDDRLDAVLERLQDELRTSHSLPDLKSHSEILYRALMRAEEQRPARTPGEILARAFVHLKLPAGLQDEWSALLEESRNTRDEVRVLEILERCAALLKQALDTVDDRKGSRGGLLGSLFGGSRTKSIPDELLREIQQRIQELLNSLSPPPELEEKLESLRQEAGGELEVAEIPSILEQINLLMQDIRGRVERERLELEKFLGQLTERLSHIEGALEETDDSTRKVFASRQELDKEIDRQTRDIASQAQEARDLATLKDVVRQRVEAIRQRMDEHQAAEQQLIRAQERQMEKLKKRLQEMEEETKELRDKVKEEQHQAFTDALTGLPNRFAYEERLEQEYERWKRYGSPLSVLIIDVDHFKQINDTYGHQAGDKALRIIARELSMATRKTDFIGRYGGEEIVVLLPETNIEAATTAAEKLRQRIESCGFHFREKRVTITVSCGVTEYRDGDTPESAFDRADQALYKAKQRGRNCCVAL